MSNNLSYATVLSIAGSDCSGGAGIQADLKTFSALGCFGMTAITAITAQNTIGVKNVYLIPSEILEQQIEAIFEDIEVKFIKTGMLPTYEIIKIIIKLLRKYSEKVLILDPVMVATSGDRLIAEETIQIMVEELFPLATLITPNLDEANLLLNSQIQNIEEMEEASFKLQKLGVKNVLVKGGHLKTEKITDVLLTNKEISRFESPKIQTKNTHGTGCSMSSAITAFLARGENLKTSVEKSHKYIYESIKSGANINIGKGHGPINHGHNPLKQIILSN